MSVADLIDLLHTFDKNLTVVIESWDTGAERDLSSAVSGSGCVILYHGEVNNTCKMCGVNPASEDSSYCDGC